MPTDFQSSIGFDSRICVIQGKKLEDCYRFNDFLDVINQTPQMNAERIELQIHQRRYLFFGYWHG